MKAIKQVDVVISAEGHALLPNQVKIIAAIKEAGNVKLFLTRKKTLVLILSRLWNVDDPKSLKKIFCIRPPQNVITLNELTSLWEKKTGKNLERIYVPEEQFLKNIQEASFPLNAALSISHTAFVKGDHTNFEIDPSVGVEASEVYPDVRYTPVNEILYQYV
ncbi:hypothetical protein HAX54_050001 [Datura stramonium]|uniref:NmrA-like domain-containing protein n=1 Tax=Datura stramonium TaxID=4076 RepID=A0ABS8SXM4_DATST|nr:hypothetical protein [Datura stramonium]